MNTMESTAQALFKRLQARKGEAVPTRDLLDLGTRSAVDQALSRLVREGKVRRLRRGLYEVPRVSTLLKRRAVQSPDHLVRAWARNNGLRVVPSGAYAANLLGLSTQVPAQMIYYTNGRTQTLMLGPYRVRLLNRGPKTMDVRGRFAPLVLQALRFVGRGGATQEVIDRLRRVLPQGSRAELRACLPFASAWMKSVVEELIAGERP